MLKLIKELAPGAVFDPETLGILTAAFDAAWASVEASGAPLSEATMPNGRAKSSANTSFRQQKTASGINSSCATKRSFSWPAQI